MSEAASRTDDVRVATAADRAAVVDTVVAAFDGDPAWTFILGADYARDAPLFAAALFDPRVESADVWVTPDCAAVAMWQPTGPGAVASELATTVWDEYRAAVGEPSWARLAAYQAGLDVHRPGVPSWYLGVLATHPDRQGKGLATAVMTPVLDRADRADLPCCLETSTVANRDFYGRRGFTDAAAVDIDGGPPTWWLTRPPR